MPFFRALFYKFTIRYRRFRTDLYFILIGLRYRRKTPKYQDEFDEASGTLPENIPQGALCVYARDAGMVQSLLPLLQILKKLKEKVILMVRTNCGKEMARRIITDEVEAVIYSAWDAPMFVCRVLDRLSPRAFIVVELERTPNPVMLDELHRRKIPLFLANGSIPEGRGSEWNKYNAFWSAAINNFDIIIVKSSKIKEDFITLGLSAEKIAVTGSWKSDAVLARYEKTDISEWRFLNTGAPLFIAGSTRGDTDNVFVLEAFRSVREKYSEARLIIAPRYLSSIGETMNIAVNYGAAVLFSETLSTSSTKWDILVVDMIGFLFEFYGISDAAFIGGSLQEEHGGQNLMEPAVFGITVAHGPCMKHFPESVAMDDVGAAVMVANYSELAEVWLGALEEINKKKTRDACKKYFESASGYVAKSWEIINVKIPAKD